MTTTDDEGPAREKPAPMKPGDRRAARLAEALRANLQRRKAQARLRRDGEVGTGDPGEEVRAVEEGGCDDADPPTPKGLRKPGRT